MNRNESTESFVVLHPLYHSLNELSAIIHELALAKGWYEGEETEEQFVMRTVANIHGECSELWESTRNGTLRMPCDKADKMVAAGIPKLNCIEEELADIIIRALDSAKRLNVDIGRAVALKHAFNKTRPIRHGNKRF